MKEQFVASPKAIAPPLVLATVFNVLICLYSQIYLAKKMSKQVASTTIMGAIINILLNIIFIRYIGLYAAALSTTISYLIMAVYRHFDLKKYVNIKIEKSLIIQMIIIYSIAISAYYINNIYLNIISLIMACFYSFIINKDFLYKSIKTVKNKLKK